MAKKTLPVLRSLSGWFGGRPTPAAVEDAGDLRHMRFGHGAVQSTMRLSAPDALELSYTRAMMGLLLFVPAPRHILMIGLGGGSLAKFCYRELPQARITVVEIDAAVIAMRDQFRIPADDARLSVVQADGCDYLARPTTPADVILVDGYDASGLPACLCSEEFYAHCRRALTPQGVLVCNFWGRDAGRETFVYRMRHVFGAAVRWSRPPQSSGLITYAPMGPLAPLVEMARRAEALDAHHDLGLQAVARDLREPPPLDD